MALEKMVHSRESSASSSWDIVNGLESCMTITLILFEKITEDALGLPAPMDEVPAQPPADLPAAALPTAIQPPVPILAASGSDIMLAQVYGIDDGGLKDDHDLIDVKVGTEVLVVSPTLQGITVDQLEASEDVEVTPDQANILLQISTGEDTKYTAAVAPFAPYAATPQAVSAEISPQALFGTIPTPARLVEPGLVPIAPATDFSEKKELLDARQWSRKSPS